MSCPRHIVVSYGKSMGEPERISLENEKIGKGKIKGKNNREGR